MSRLSFHTTVIPSASEESLREAHPTKLDQVMFVAHRLPNQRPLTLTGFAGGFFGYRCAAPSE